MILRREIDDLKNEVKVLQEKTTSELLRELQEKFADTPGLIDAKKLQKDMYLFSYFVKISSFRLNLFQSSNFTLRNYSATTGIFSA